MALGLLPWLMIGSAAGQFGSSLIGARAAGKASEGQEQAATEAARLGRLTAEEQIALQRDIANQQTALQYGLFQFGTKALPSMTRGMGYGIPPGGYQIPTLQSLLLRPGDASLRPEAAGLTANAIATGTNPVHTLSGKWGALVPVLGPVALLGGLFGRGRREADALVPYQNAFTTEVARIMDELQARRQKGSLQPADLQTAHQTVSDLRQQFYDLTNKFGRAGPGARRVIGGWTDQLLQDWAKEGGFAGMRQGGPVGGGNLYMVGEEGPEVLEMEPGAEGWVYPNRTLRNLTGRKQGGKVRGQEKVHRVMGEFKRGNLRSSSGQKVTSREQAIAIAMSEAGLARREYGGPVGRMTLKKLSHRQAGGPVGGVDITQWGWVKKPEGWVHPETNAVGQWNPSGTFTNLTTQQIFDPAAYLAGKPALTAAPIPRAVPPEFTGNTSPTGYNPPAVGSFLPSNSGPFEVVTLGTGPLEYHSPTGHFLPQGTQIKNPAGSVGTLDAEGNWVDWSPITGPDGTVIKQIPAGGVQGPGGITGGGPTPQPSPPPTKLTLPPVGGTLPPTASGDVPPASTLSNLTNRYRTMGKDIPTGPGGPGNETFGDWAWDQAGGVWWNATKGLVYNPKTELLSDPNDPSRGEWSRFDPYPGEFLEPFAGEFTGRVPNRPFKFNTEDLFKDPGYQYRLKRGQEAIEESAAARGGLLSGRTLKDMMRFGQELGTQEFEPAYARAFGENQLGYGRDVDSYNRALNEYRTAYDIFKQNQGDRYNRIAAMLGLAQTTAGQLGSTAQVAGNQIGNLALGSAQNQASLIQQIADARAAGDIGRANALIRALGTPLSLAQLLAFSKGT